MSGHQRNETLMAEIANHARREHRIGVGHSLVEKFVAGQALAKDRAGSDDRLEEFDCFSISLRSFKVDRSELAQPTEIRVIAEVRKLHETSNWVVAGALNEGEIVVVLICSLRHCVDPINHLTGESLGPKPVQCPSFAVLNDIVEYPNDFGLVSRECKHHP